MTLQNILIPTAAVDGWSENGLEQAPGMAWNKGREWPGTRPGNGLEQGPGMAWNKAQEWPGTRPGNSRGG